jgi:hypothetical protein
MSIHITTIKYTMMHVDAKCWIPYTLCCHMCPTNKLDFFYGQLQLFQFESYTDKHNVQLV